MYEIVRFQQNILCASIKVVFSPFHHQQKKIKFPVSRKKKPLKEMKWKKEVNLLIISRLREFLQTRITLNEFQLTL